MAARWLVRMGWSGWRREVGWVLVFLAVLVVCGSAFPMAGGIPYQDPTPEMLAQQAEQHQAEIVFLIGAGVAFGMVVAGVWLMVMDRRADRRASPTTSATEQP